MALLGIENMPFYTCLTLGVNKRFPVYAYIRVLKTAALYNHTIHCKDSTLNLPIFASQIMHLYVCYHTYAHIVVCKDTCPQMHYVVLSNASLCIPLSRSLRMLLYICLYVRVFKCTYIYMIILASQWKHISVCPYQLV